MPYRSNLCAESTNYLIGLYKNERKFHNFTIGKSALAGANTRRAGHISLISVVVGRVICIFDIFGLLHFAKRSRTLNRLGFPIRIEVACRVAIWCNAQINWHFTRDFVALARSKKPYLFSELKMLSSDRWLCWNRECRISIDFVNKPPAGPPSTIQLKSFAFPFLRETVMFLIKLTTFQQYRRVNAISTVFRVPPAHSQPIFNRTRWMNEMVAGGKWSTSFVYARWLCVCVSYDESTAYNRITLLPI